MGLSYYLLVVGLVSTNSNDPPPGWAYGPNGCLPHDLKRCSLAPCSSSTAPKMGGQFFVETKHVREVGYESPGVRVEGSFVTEVPLSVAGADVGCGRLADGKPLLMHSGVSAGQHPPSGVAWPLRILLRGHPSHNAPMPSGGGDAAADGPREVRWGQREGGQGTARNARPAAPIVPPRKEMLGSHLGHPGSQSEALPARKYPALRGVAPSRRGNPRVGPRGSYLVDSASSHMLVSKIKPCMSKYKQLYCETANGSLNQLSFI
jgi:hypothetical protein